MVLALRTYLFLYFHLSSRLKPVFHLSASFYFQYLGIAGYTWA